MPDRAGGVHRRIDDPLELVDPGTEHLDVVAATQRDHRDPQQPHQRHRRADAVERCRLLEQERGLTQLGGQHHRERDDREVEGDGGEGQHLEHRRRTPTPSPDGMVCPVVSGCVMWLVSDMPSSRSPVVPAD